MDAGSAPDRIVEPQPAEAAPGAASDGGAPGKQAERDARNGRRKDGPALKPGLY